LYERVVGTLVVKRRDDLERRDRGNDLICRHKGASILGDIDVERSAHLLLGEVGGPTARWAPLAVWAVRSQDQSGVKLRHRAPSGC
jgi:hypothetical protein